MNSNKTIMQDWRSMLRPTLFLIAVIYYDEIFLKFYCFGAMDLSDAFFTLLFTVPIAMGMGLICGGIAPRYGRWMLVLCTAIVSLWLGGQMAYYHMFKAFTTIFSMTKLGMVATSFGDMVGGNIVSNWFSIMMMVIPVLITLFLRNVIVRDEDCDVQHRVIKWGIFTATVQLGVLGIVMLSGGGAMSPSYLYAQAAAPVLEVRQFGMLTQTQLDFRRVLFGIELEELDKIPEPPEPPVKPLPPIPEPVRQYNVLEIDFDSLAADALIAEDEQLLAMHRHFAQRGPTAKNEWTGEFEGKNLIWIVAEGFCTLAMDPERTPTLWKLANEGFQFENFYTPLWGVSTSDGEYVTTTGLVPKPGVWSYSQSAENYMPFAFGNQFKKLGYTTQAYHNYLYTYYDRDQSYPNMGYDYYGLGNGLELEELWPPSDLEMMEEIVPRFVNEEQFMVYCLTVSGHLNYTYEENAMAQRHWDSVAELEYSEAVKSYLACQMELEMALTSLVEQLEEAGKLDDTVIAISGDHYPYGLTDEEYSELLGHPVDTQFEIYENSFILWNSEMEEPVVVDKLSSSLDVMPTLANLFGLPYDSRLVAGQDILSDSEGFVLFSDYSALTEYGSYNAHEDVFTAVDGGVMDEKMMREILEESQNRVAYSAAILDTNYYELVLGDNAP